MKFIVESPVKGYNGTSAGVVFKDGSGETDDPRIAEWLEKKGYTVIKEKSGKDKKKGEDPPEEKPANEGSEANA